MPFYLSSQKQDCGIKNIDNYYEVFIDTPIETLVKRDSKGLYSKFQRGEISNVAGMDIDFPKP